MPTPPATAKKPADRQAKKAEITEFTMTVYGIDVSIAVEALDDFEFMDDIGRVDDGDLSRAPIALRRLVGSEKMRELMDAVRDPDTGRVTSEAGAGLFMDIFKAVQEQAPNS